MSTEARKEGTTNDLAVFMWNFCTHMLKGFKFRKV